MSHRRLPQLTAVLTLLVPFAISRAGWYLDSITSRPFVDQTCRNNTRAVVSDPAGNIHVVWRGQAPDTFAIWYSSWDHARRQWSNDSIIFRGMRSAGEPAIACDSGGNIYVLWPANGLLWLKRRSFITGEWDLIDSLRSDLSDIAVALAIDQFRYQHCCWNRKTPTGNALLLYTRRSDTGWSRTETVAVIANYEPVRPAIACSPSGTVMVTWNHPPNPYIIAARRRLAHGWAAMETVYSYQNSSAPAVCAGPDSFYVIWISGPSSSQSVLCRARGENGWGDTCRLSQWTRSKLEPSIVCDDSGNLHCAWIDEHPVNRTRQVCYRRRTADLVWDTIQVLTPLDANVNRERLSISARQSTIQIAWTDIITQQPYLSGVRLLRYEQLSDVAILRIIHPGDTIDSAAVFTPMAVIKNTGDLTAESILVFFHLADSSRSSFLNQLDVNESTVVVFDSLPVHTRGNSVALCSLRFRNDAVPNNNSVTRTTYVRVQDVVLESIITPRNRIYDLTLRPRIKIRNAGNVTASFTACCSIFRASQQPPVYTQTLILRLEQGVTRDTGFSVWNTDTGNFLVRFRLQLSGDQHPENDTAGRNFRVINLDAGTIAILWPAGVVDSGTTGQPQVVIKNHGEETTTVIVKLRIGEGYNDTVSLAIGSGESATVRFRHWQAAPRGTQTVFCSLSSPGDRNPDNDTLSGRTFVRVLDAGVVAVVKPDSINSRGAIAPQIRLRNAGNATINLSVYCRIYDSTGVVVYNDSLILAGLEPEQESLVRLSVWQATGGTYRICAQTILAGDQHPENDTLSKSFRVTRRDAAVLRIIAPAESLTAGTITPLVTVANHGEEMADLLACIYILALVPDTNPVYADSLPVRLATGDSVRLRFRDWQAQPGVYQVLTLVRLAGDENPANDSLILICQVESVPSRRWLELPPIPAGAYNKPVRAGGALVATNSKLFAFKGGGSNEFWEYDPFTRQWSERRPLPAGPLKRKIRAGAALCWDGGNYIFALKGNNSREFWCYEITTDSWLALPSLPEYTAGVKAGSGLAYILKRDTGNIFCLKGSGTFDLLVYWIRQREWHARRPVPRGPANQPVKAGSALTRLGSRLFVLKGRTNEFYEYCVAGDSWRMCSGLPRIDAGREKRCLSGAALTSDQQRYIYAFKGGRSNEFWRYDVLRDTWERLEDLPLGSRWRRVGPGGALAFINGDIYALKGGGTLEFWSYRPAGTIQPVRKPVPQKQQQVLSRTMTTYLYNEVAQGQTRIRDVAGRIRADSRFSSGVYFVIKSTPAGGTEVQKLVIIR